MTICPPKNTCAKNENVNLSQIFASPRWFVFVNFHLLCMFQTEPLGGGGETGVKRETNN